MDRILAFILPKRAAVSGTARDQIRSIMSASVHTVVQRGWLAYARAIKTNRSIGFPTGRFCYKRKELDHAGFRYRVRSVLYSLFSVRTNDRLTKFV